MAVSPKPNEAEARWISKEEANRIAAAKVYMKAAQKADRPVPRFIEELAKRER